MCACSSVRAGSAWVTAHHVAVGAARVRLARLPARKECRHDSSQTLAPVVSPSSTVWCDVVCVVCECVL
jgi:hypothetical protein